MRPLEDGEVVNWGPQQYQWDGAFFAPTGVLVDDPLSWFLCPLIADALDLTTYPSHLVPRPADTNCLPDFPRDDGDMTWTHLVWLCREALRSMYERLENGVAAADDLRAHWPTGFQERLSSRRWRSSGRLGTVPAVQASLTSASASRLWR